MTETEKHTENTTKAPFQDEILLENFYAGAGRGDLLVRMQGAVENGVPLMVLSGGEGSGKTMMCRMLENECPTSTLVVFFPVTVESFEDVVRIIAKKLDLDLPAPDEGMTIDAAIEQIIAHLLRQSKELLIIFDEAEDIYLATLERIRRMLDRITASGVRMRILFSGRKTFLENCEQLSICDFRTTKDLHFDLLPLTEEETSEYLRTCSERLPTSERRKVFNAEVVRNIHSLAKGRFRKIKFLANESLSSHGDDTSFMVLLDNVEDAAEAEEDNPETGRPRMGRSFAAMWWIGGALCTLLLLSFFFNSGEERRVIKPVPLPSSTDNTKVEATQIGGNPQQPDIRPQAQEVTQPARQDPEISKQQPEMLEQKVASVPEIEPTVTAEATGSSEMTPEISELPPATAQLTPKKEIELLPAPVRTKVGTIPEIKVPVLRPIPPLKVKPRSASEPASGAAKVLPRTEVQETVGATAHLTVDQLYQKRLHAGTAWVSGEKNDKFTVQLMVLTAKNAELNLKKMLAQPNYRQEAGNFFIFRKNGSPEVVLVFYGEYSTIDQARLAQNSLPQFLREHQPYAVSVRGALAKVGK